MSYRALFVFVEGQDDERFFNEVCAPLVLPDVHVKTIQYAGRRREEIAKLLAALPHIDAKPGNTVTCLFLIDADGSPCPTARKAKCREIFPELPERRIIVVVRMIEGWYLAGLDGEACEALDCRELCETNSVDKSGFEAALQQTPTIDLKERLLERYDIEVAQRKNASFDYFMHRLTAHPLFDIPEATIQP